MRRLLALTLVLAATAVVAPTWPASAGPAPEDIRVELVSPVEPLTFSAEIGVDIECASVTVTRVEANNAEVTPLAVVPDDTDPNVVYIVLASDTPPGEPGRRGRLCDVRQAPIERRGRHRVGCAGGDQGRRRPGALPTPHSRSTIACESEPSMEPEPTATAGYDGVGTAGILSDYDVDLAFGATGGTKYVYFDEASECLITEPADGGATSTTIAPAEIINDAPKAYASTVTNTFAAEIEPTFTG